MLLAAGALLVRHSTGRGGGARRAAELRGADREARAVSARQKSQQLGEHIQSLASGFSMSTSFEVEPAGDTTTTSVRSLFSNWS